MVGWRELRILRFLERKGGGRGVECDEGGAVGVEVWGFEDGGVGPMLPKSSPLMPRISMVGGAVRNVPP